MPVTTPAGLLLDFDLTLGTPSGQYYWRPETPIGSTGTVRTGSLQTDGGVRCILPTTNSSLTIDFIRWRDANQTSRPGTGDADPQDTGNVDDLDDQADALTFYWWYSNTLLELPVADNTRILDSRTIDWQIGDVPDTWASGLTIRYILAHAGQSAIVSDFVQGIGTPDAPAAPTLADGDTQVTASWVAPNANNSVITGYHLEHSTDQTNWTRNVLGDVTSHTVTGLTNGTLYYFRVRAINAQGDGDWSDEASATPMSSASAPEAATGLTATAGNAEVALTWTLNGDGGSALTGLVVAYTPDGGSEMTQTLALTATSATVSGLTNGTEYTFAIRKTNMIGSTDSASVTATPIAPPVASFTTASVNLRVVFTDTSTNTPTSWSWNFGDGNVSTDRHPVHSYSAAGDYTVQLTATNAGGSGMTSETVTVTASPVQSGSLITGENEDARFLVTVGGSEEWVDTDPNAPIGAMTGDADLPPEIEEVNWEGDGPTRLVFRRRQGQTGSFSTYVNANPGKFMYILIEDGPTLITRSFGATTSRGAHWIRWNITTQSIRDSLDTVAPGQNVLFVVADSGTVEIDTEPEFDSEPVNQTGMTGTAFTYTLPAASSGNAPLTYSVSGEPSWASFDAGRRVLSGNPDAAGTTTVTYTVTDEDGDTDTADFDITITTTDTTPSFDSDPVNQTGMVGTAFSYTLPAASGGNTPLTYSVSNEPSWASFNATTRVLSGTPDAVATTTVTYTVTDVDNDTDTATFDIAIAAADTTPSFESEPVNQTGTTGVAFNYRLPEASGGNPPLTYSVSNEPSWATFNAASRVLTGTPDAVGTTTVTYTVTDADNDTDTATFDIVISAPDTTPSFDSEPVNQAGTVGQAFSYTLPAASSGNPPLTYSVSNEPSWANFNASTRVLSGTPDAADTTTVTYTVTDSDNDTDTATFNIVISAVDLMPTLDDVADQTGNVAEAFTLTLPEATGGDTPLTYSVTGEPSWASFNSGTRVLSGTPDAVATTTVTYTVSDADNDTASVMFDIAIAASAPAVPDTPTLELQSDNGVLVRWAHPDDNGSAILNYTIRWRTGGGAYTDHTTNFGTTIAYTIPGSVLTRSATYEVGVRATNAIGSSLYQADQPTILTGNVPDAPDNVRTTAITHNSIDVAWDVPDANEHAITGYTAHLQQVGGASVENRSTSTPSYTWPGLMANTQYRLWARATNSLGNSGNSTIITATTAEFVQTAPGAPTSFTATAGNSHIALSWGVPTSDGNAAITGYSVEYQRGVGGPYTEVEVDETVRSHVFKPLENGQAYTVRVGATNSIGTTYTTSMTVTPDASENFDFDDDLITVGTDEDARFIVTVGDFGTPANDSAERMWLNLVSDPNIGSVTGDNSLPPAIGRMRWNGNDTRGHFILNRESGETASLDEWFNFHEAWSFLFLNDASPSSGILLRAVDTHSGGGADWKRWEIAAGATRDAMDAVAIGNRLLVVVAATGTFDLAELPGAPTAVTVTAGVNELAVSWTAPADNGGYDIQNYYVETRTGTNPWSREDAGTATSLTVTGLSANVEYDVRVKAKTQLGYGDFSGVANGTPTATMPPATPVTAPVLAAVVNGITVSSVSNTAGSDPSLGYSLRYREDGQADDQWVTIADVSSIPHTITPLTPGQLYNVQYATKNQHGTSGFSPSTTIAPLNAAPSTPSSTSLTASFTSITWVWAAGSGGGPVNNYLVRWRVHESMDGYSSHTTTATTYTIPNLTPDTSYELQLSAVGPGGQSGFVSAVLGTLAQEAPGEIDDLTVTAGNASLTLNWTEPDLGTASLDRYRVQYRPGTAGSWTDLATLNPTNYHISSLVNGQLYQVRVRAETAHGNGPYQDPPLSGTPVSQFPTAPRNVSASVNFMNITLSWDAPLSAGLNGTISGYQYTFQGVGELLQTRNTTNTEATIMGLTANLEYSMRVRAQNQFGFGDWSGFVRATTIEDPDVPDRITSVNVTEGNMLVSFTWSAPDDNRSPIIEYQIERKLATEDDTAWGNRRLYLQPSASVGGLTNGVEYNFRIRARNGVGEAPWSPTLTATPRGLPGVPQPVLTPGVRQIVATWPAVSDGGATITEYQARISTDDTTWAEESTGTNTTVTFHTLTPGQQYYVGARAMNAHGWSDWTDPSVTATVPTQVPDRMETPLVTSGIRRLVVGWVAPPSNGSAIIRYDIDYSVNQSAWSRATAGASAVSHVIQNLDNGVLYYVRIRAVNGVGVGAWSTIVSRQTAALASQPNAPTISERAESLFVQWVAPFNGGSNIVEYTVRWREDGTSGAWSDHSLNALEYLIPNLMDGVAYEVQVAATNAVGIGPYSDSSVGTPQMGAVIPARPAQPPALVSDDQQITATWSEPYDGGDPILDYTLRYRIGTGAWVNRTVTASPYTQTGLTNGTTYEFQFRARNSVGVGPWSRSAFAIPSVHIADTLVSFGAFSFATFEKTDVSVDHLNQSSIDDNFAEVVPIMTRLPFTDGAFDQYGTGVAPQAPGSVRASFWIVARHRSFMRDMRAAFARMASYGLTTLTKNALDGIDVTCLARIRRVTWPREVAQAAHRQLTVSVEWSVPSPGWLSSTLTQLDHSNVGDNDTLSVSVSGEKHVRPRIRITRASGSTNVTEVVIKRAVGGTDVDEITYGGTIDSNDTVWIDCGARTVEENDSDAFDDFDAESGAWLLLDPNVANELTVEVSPSNAEVDLRFEYRAGYYN